MKIHVLFTGLVSDDSLSGGDQLFIDLAERLPKEIEVTLVMPHFGLKFWEPLKLSNVEFKVLPKNIFDGKRNSLFVFLTYLVRSFQAWQFLKKEEVGIIYSSSDIVLSDILPAYLLKSRNKNFLWLTRIYHVILPPQKRKGNFLVNLLSLLLQRLSFKLMIARADKILALNEALYKELIGLKFPEQKLGVLGAGVSFGEINDYQPDKKYDYQVVVLGRIHPVKGIYDMVEIWKKVVEKHPNYKLAWIGLGAESFVKELKNKIKENNLEDSFQLLGFLPKKEVYNILKSAQVFFCPDYENGWGLAVCEAMSAKLPVVSYDIDIFGSVYKKGFVSAKLGDINSFANNALDLLENEEKRKKLALEAKEQAAEFDHNKVVNDLMKILKSSS